MINRVGKHLGDLVEFRTAELEIEVSIAQRKADVFEWSAGDRAPETIHHAHPGDELPTRRTPGTQSDGAFMEPSGRNQWQSAANRPTPKPAKTSEIRCRGLSSVAATPKW
jgi:hypothetical protein